MNEDKIGEIYQNIAEWFDQNRDKSLVEKLYLERLLQFVKPNPAVLDLGCGSGEPIARFLVQRGCYVTGVDGSSNMIAMCRQRFPDSEWIQADMRSLNLHRTFDALIAWDSFFHLSHDAQRNMFAVFASYMKMGGVLLFTSGDEYGEVYGVMNGHAVYHASLDSVEYQSLLETYGFDVLIHTINDVACGGRTVWLAKKIGSA